MPPIVKICEIPEMNPIRFIRDGHANAGYQGINNNWFAKQQEYWNAQTNYNQKYTFSDFLGIQIALAGLYTNVETSIRLQFLDCNGKVIGQEQWVNNGFLTGNTYTYNGVPYNLKTYNFKTQFSKYIAEEGIYFLRLELPYIVSGQGKQDYYISEPILVRHEHPGTRLLEYISYSNKYSVYYTSNIFFHLRVEGELVYEQPKNNSVQYDDQNMNPRLQSATPYREMNLKLGYPGGLPMWMFDKINRAFDNDYVLCDKTRYVREGEMEIGTRVPRWLKYGGSLKLREYDNNAASIIAETTPFALYGVTGYPYYIYTLAMSNSGNGSLVVLTEGYEIRNPAEETQFIDNVLNAVVVPDKGLRGRVLKSSNGFVMYENGIDEYFDTANAAIFTKVISLTYGKAAGPTQIQPSIRVNTIRCGIVFNQNYEAFNGGNGSTYTDFQPPYTYDSTILSPTVRIYHADQIKQLYVYEFGKPGTLVDIQGTLPNILERIELIGCALPNGLNMALVPTTLNTLIVRYCSIFFNGPYNFAKNWTALHTVAINNNFLSTADVDRIFNEHYNGNGYTPPADGVFRINNQTPAAPPTNASLSARNKLIAASWLVQTD